MKVLTIIVISISVLVSACGKDLSQAEIIRNSDQQLKCDKTLYIQKSGEIYIIPGTFEKACKLNPDGTKQAWNKMYRSGSDYTCGFWVTDQGGLVTDFNKELTLDVTQYGNCL